MRRTCCSAMLADRCCDDIKHAIRHRANCLNKYCKNTPFSIKWYVYNCLYSIPTLTGKHLHLGITHKWHVCEYMFLYKKWSYLHGLSSLSFCRWGPVTPCIVMKLKKYSAITIYSSDAPLLAQVNAASIYAMKAPFLLFHNFIFCWSKWLPLQSPLPFFIVKTDWIVTVPYTKL